MPTSRSRTISFALFPAYKIGAILELKVDFGVNAKTVIQREKVLHKEYQNRLWLRLANRTYRRIQ